MERIDLQLALISGAARAIEIEPSPATDAGGRYRQQQGFATVRVFYGTNRKPTGRATPAEFYGTERGELQVGYLDVTVPESHRQGELETQSRWSVLHAVRRQGDAEAPLRPARQCHAAGAQCLAAGAARPGQAAPSHDVFVFVHGFNSSFEDAARRTAQLAYDLDFDGTPLMYSWPSQASTYSYTVDEASGELQRPLLADFLEDVVAQSGAERVHLIAHSMGNRALIEALQTWMSNHDAKSRRKAFGQIVFTAPDVDRDYFTDVIDPLSQTAERVTLYASDKDRALKLRRQCMARRAPAWRARTSSPARAGHHRHVLGRGRHAGPQLLRGRCGGHLRPVPAVVARRSAAAALRHEFARNARPARQPVAVRRECLRGQELLEAGVLVKRFGDRPASAYWTASPY